MTIDKKKAKHYYELGAMNGDIRSRLEVGGLEGQAGNIQRAYKHCLLAARAGHANALKLVKEGYKVGFVTKEEYSNTLREYQKSQDEMKSEARDKVANLLNY